MSPIRLVILAILIYIGYLLIKGSSGRKGRKNIEKDTPSDVADVLMECPKCQKLVPKLQAHELEDEDGIQYFCSKECYNAFISDKGAGK